MISNGQRDSLQRRIECGVYVGNTGTFCRFGAPEGEVPVGSGDETEAAPAAPAISLYPF